MKKNILFGAVALIGLLSCNRQPEVITYESLLGEMTGLERLSRLPEVPYRTVQYSSYDRRSVTPDDSTWFSNDDGFGGETLPGFEKVLAEPDSSGTGVYLICDVRAPGVVQRLWTAAISGKIRFFIDSEETPVYEGNAEDFFWKTGEVLTGSDTPGEYSRIFRQFDATYLPIPFSRLCRIEWIGKLSETHFYHVGIRTYPAGTQVEPFSASLLGSLSAKIAETGRILSDPELLNPTDPSTLVASAERLQHGDSREVFTSREGGAIGYLWLQVVAKDMEAALRKTLITICFDDEKEPQVYAPVGDFFGAAPGVNPYQSLPYTVGPDSSMVCRFFMPYRRSVRITLENQSEGDVGINLRVKRLAHRWIPGKTMYFGARWSVSNNLTANNTDSRIEDILYLDARGTGRVVGAAAYLNNPATAPTSWGNWWGEGDEKIFVDGDTFPSFFGTGSEDYFNYSWSSPRIFAYPYCGQPRNDGPDNRGFVTNYRWHITDDIPFSERVRFYMELRHHDRVAGLDYARMVWYYALPGATTGYRTLAPEELLPVRYRPWMPVGYLGSAGNDFIQAEEMAKPAENLKVIDGEMFAGGKALGWKPAGTSEQLLLTLPFAGTDKSRIGFTLEHGPDGGTVRCLVNGNPMKIDNQESISLMMPYRTVLRNHFTGPVDWRKGENRIVFEMTDADGSRTLNIDFMWIKTR